MALSFYNKLEVMGQRLRRGFYKGPLQELIEIVSETA